jgi:hypothetical protein
MGFNSGLKGLMAQASIITLILQTRGTQKISKYICKRKNKGTRMDSMTSLI